MKYPIPIQNLYYIFCYAWKKIEEGDAIDVQGIDSPELADLFASVLIRGLNHLQRRGLDRGYVPDFDALTALRGRVQVRDTIQLQSRRSPQVFCQFDEFKHNILNNQILKATIKLLVRASGLDPKLREALVQSSKRFDDVSDVHLSNRHFHQAQIHRNNSFYDFLLSVCELIYSLALPDENGEGFRFSDILRDEEKMALVFETFVRNFFSIESEYEVVPLQLSWDAVAKDDQQLSLLPKMVTDIHLTGGKRRIIVDAKYYRETFQEHHGKLSIHSANLYQLFAYLKNSEARGSDYRNSEGILLYPTVDKSLPFKAVFQGHPIQIATINLNQAWPQIRSDLLAILEN